MASREDIAKEVNNYCNEKHRHSDSAFERYLNIADWHEAEIKKARVEVANKALYESDIDCTECVHVGERDLCTKSPECPCVEGYLKFIISDNTEGVSDG